MRRFSTVAPLILGVLLAACANGAGAGSGSTGVLGVVVAGPTCPVERADSPCPDRPLEGVRLRIVDANGSEVTSVQSGHDGRFRVALDPGSYQILTTVQTGSIQFAKPLAVTVPSHGFVHATVLVDTGIRMPVSSSG